MVTKNWDESWVGQGIASRVTTASSAVVAAPGGSEDDASCSRRASACIQARLRRSAYTVDTVATVRFIKEAQKLGNSASL